MTATDEEKEKEKEKEKMDSCSKSTLPLYVGRIPGLRLFPLKMRLGVQHVLFCIIFYPIEL